MPRFAGFWSYVHDDDADDGGRVLSLAERLRQEFRLLSGESLELFVDRGDLRWGEEWERRIAEALQETTFFIPVITPSYFQHPECRKELLRFVTEVRRLGVEQLLLPIYYIQVRELEDAAAPSDEAMVIIRRTQWEDMRKLRLKDESDPEHRALVNKLALRLLEIAEATESDMPPPVPANLDPDPAAPRGSGDGIVVIDAGTTPAWPAAVRDTNEGFLELLAAGEKALPEWLKTIEALSPQMTKIGELADQSTSEIAAADQRGAAGFASRLQSAKRLAQRLGEPADRIVELGQQYVAQLLTIDPAIETLLTLAAEDPAWLLQAGEMFDGIRRLAAVSRTSMKSTRELINSLDQNARFSRDLQLPVRKINGALRNIADAQVIIDRWEQGIDQLAGDSTP